MIIATVFIQNFSPLILFDLFFFLRSNMDILIFTLLSKNSIFLLDKLNFKSGMICKIYEPFDCRPSIEKWIFVYL